jgi:hypothetical protein
MKHFAVDPLDWGGRIKVAVDHLIPNERVRSALIEDGGRPITPGFLERAVPVPELRPDVHGEIVDLQTGRSLMTRFLSDGIERTFDNIASKPTELLARHPLFNYAYKAKLQAIADREVAYEKARAAAQGVEPSFSMLGDYARWERVARRSALATVKRTLWDVSGTSHAAHALRYVSPFFTAHQWALNRWWHVAEVNPAVVPHMQQFFDDWRRTGLVHDQNGNPVTPLNDSDFLGTNTTDRVWIRVPFLGEDQGINKWVKSLGGGENYDFGLNGLNVILHAGVDKPGLGPMASIPLQALAAHFRDNGTLQKVANYFDGMAPKGGWTSQVLPGSVAKIVAAYQGYMDSGSKNALYVQTFNMEQGELHSQFLMDHGREPTPKEAAAILQQAGTRATADLMREALTNLAFFTPAKAEGRFSVERAGWKTILAQGQQQGWDFTRMHQEFDQRFGSVFEPLLESSSANPAHLTGTVGEVGAIRRYSGLLSQLQNPAMADMVIGPAAAMAPASDQQYSQDARTWEQNTTMGPGNSNTWIGGRDPKTMLDSSIVSDGWGYYDQLTTALQARAAQAGIPSWRNDPTLKAVYKSVVAAIRCGADYREGPVPAACR